MRERLVSKTPQPMKAFIEVNGEAEDVSAELARLEALVREKPVDVACIGIGENGHIAFNDPPADFEAKAAYAVVDLDEKCRMQQVGEGWFASLDDVPRQAFSMTVPQIMSARAIVCTVPDSRKADAVAGAVDGTLTNMCPASILRQHSDCTMFLDPPSAAKLKEAE
jgi:glucosamine-6-phosphate deaminase